MDVIFYHCQQPLPLSTLITNLNCLDLIWLHIDNQKNGHQGQIISHQTISSDCCPIEATTTCILSLLCNGASPNTPISACCPSLSAPFQHVTNEDILLAVHSAIPHNPNEVKGYAADLVGSHLFWAGGTMALFQQGCKMAKLHESRPMDKHHLYVVYSQATQHSQQRCSTTNVSGIHLYQPG